MNDDEEVRYVKLISAEGHEFLMARDVAIAHSKTIRLMLEGSFREAHDNVIRFPDLAGYTLERVVKYLHYKAQYSNSTSRIPEFVSVALGKSVCALLTTFVVAIHVIEPEVALELLLAAKYLDC